MFGQPDRVVAGLVHDLDTLERAFVHSGQRYAALGPTEELKDSDFHKVDRFERYRRCSAADTPFDTIAKDLREGGGLPRAAKQPGRFARRRHAGVNKRLHVATRRM